MSIKEVLVLLSETYQIQGILKIYLFKWLIKMKQLSHYILFRV